jgi:hypothetical protein
LNSRSPKRWPAGLADPADLLLGSCPGDAERIAALAAQEPWSEADDVRFPPGDRQDSSTAAADEERRMRALDRLRLAVHLGDRVVLAVERKDAIAQEALDNGDRLLHPRDADSDRIERQPDRLVLRLVPARTEADIEPAVT